MVSQRWLVTFVGQPISPLVDYCGEASSTTIFFLSFFVCLFVCFVLFVCFFVCLLYHQRCGSYLMRNPLLFREIPLGSMKSPVGSMKSPSVPRNPLRFHETSLGLGSTISPFVSTKSPSVSPNLLLFRETPATPFPPPSVSRNSLFASQPPPPFSVQTFSSSVCMCVVCVCLFVCV